MAIASTDIVYKHSGGAHAVGLVLIVSALSGSIQDIVKRIRAQSADKS